MSMYDFMSSNPGLTFFLFLLSVLLLRSVVKNILIYCISRSLRSRNIKLHRWPPKHLDADGDFKPED